jgi:hypothetical protein
VGDDRVRADASLAAEKAGSVKSDSSALLDEMLSYHQPEAWNLAARRIRAKTIPLGERASTSQVPADSRTSSEVAITAQTVAAGESSRRGPREQYRPVTEEQSRAFRALRTIPCPLTPKSVAAVTGWTRSTAKRWLSIFAAKGALVARTGKGAGHYWSEK